MLQRSTRVAAPAGYALAQLDSACSPAETKQTVLPSTMYASKLEAVRQQHKCLGRGSCGVVGICKVAMCCTDSHGLIWVHRAEQMCSCQSSTLCCFFTAS